jgi:hypothetical protein
MRGVILKGTTKVIRVQRALCTTLKRRTLRRKLKRPRPPLAVPPEHCSDEENLGLTESSSLSVEPLSLSEEEREPKKSSTRTQATRYDRVLTRLPNRHKSLIGHQAEREFLTGILSLSRLPCNLAELRRCRRVYWFTQYIVYKCKQYRDPSFIERRPLRSLLNIVLRLPIKSLLDVERIKRDYSPNLPNWLFRIVTTSLIHGNAVTH